MAEEIRSRKEPCEIVFLTTSDEFAVEAFAIGATHYIVKPYKESQFKEAMNRVMEHFSKLKSSKIMLKINGGGVRVFLLDEILWIESYNHSQTITLKQDRKEEVRETLSQIFTMLEEVSPGQFAIPCKGFLVNQNAILTIEPQKLIMNSGYEIPMARGNFRTFQENFFQYTFSNKEGIL